MSTNSKKEYDHNRYEQNKDEIKERNRKYWDAHREELNTKIREKRKQSNDASRETATNNNQRWTTDDMLDVLMMFEDGQSISQIAPQVNRSEDAVKSVMKRKAFKELKENNLNK